MLLTLFLFQIIEIVILNVAGQTHSSSEKDDSTFRFNSSRNCSLLWGDQDIVYSKSYDMAILSTISYLDWTIDLKWRQREIRVKSCREKFNRSIRGIEVDNIYLRYDSHLVDVAKNAIKCLNSIIQLVLGMLKKIKGQIRRHKDASNAKSTYSKCKEVKYELLWFFSNWNEGMWHDTEVMIAESKDEVVIAFRGTENVVDMLTNSQTFEPISHSKFFQGLRYGSIQRGILNAYSRVDQGEITKLSPSNESRNVRKNNIFFENVEKIFNHQKNRSSETRLNKKIKTYDFESSNTRKVSGIKLSGILHEIAIRVLKSEKKLVICGHSLGGALSLVLALDVLHHADLSSYSARIFKKLSVYSYGGPEFADETFYESIISHSALTADFLLNRFFRFVSLTKYPECVPDIVTRITSKVGAIIGDLLIGSRSGQVARKGLVIRSRGTILRVYPTVSSPSIWDGLLVRAPIYLCSGSASSSIDAHGMMHHLRGLAYAAQYFKLAPEHAKAKQQRATYLLANVNRNDSKILGLIPIEDSDCYALDVDGMATYIC